MKPKQINLNTLILIVVSGVLTWAGSTLESVRREVDVIKVQLADYKQSVDDKVTALKSDDAKRDVMLGEIRIELSRLRRAAPPKNP